MEDLEVATIGSGAVALLRLFRELWEHKVISMEWKHSVIIPITRRRTGWTI